MKPSREVIIPRIHCPHCGEAGHRIYKTLTPHIGADTRRYARCRTCGKKFHIIETNDFGMFHSVEGKSFGGNS